jgi:hypothetical protein
MNRWFVIARSASDATLHEYCSAPPWIATAFGLAMTEGRRDVHGKRSAAFGLEMAVGVVIFF